MFQIQWESRNGQFESLKSPFLKHLKDNRNRNENNWQFLRPLVGKIHFWILTPFNSFFIERCRLECLGRNLFLILLELVVGTRQYVFQCNSSPKKMDSTKFKNRSGPIFKTQDMPTSQATCSTIWRENQTCHYHTCSKCWRLLTVDCFRSCLGWTRTCRMMGFLRAMSKGTVEVQICDRNLHYIFCLTPHTN